MKVLSDTWLVFQRAVGQTARNPVMVVVMIVQPMIFLFLFAPLLKSSLRGVDPEKVINLYLPGLLVQLALFSCLYACFSLTTEQRFGVIERFQVTPISRFALLLGRTLRDALVMLIQCTMISVAALLFGLRIYPFALVMMTVILVLIAMAVAPFSYAMAMYFKRDEVLGPAVNLVAMPLLLLSGILLPMTYAPAWLRTLSLANPLTTVVEGSRELYAGHIWNNGIALAVGLAVGCAALSLAFSARLFIRSAE